MNKPPTVKPRSRAGSWDVFVRRYQPIDKEDKDFVRYWNDSEVRATKSKHFVWTVVDNGNGKCYVVPGFATVNYVGRILCRVPWSDVEFSNPGYSF